MGFCIFVSYSQQMIGIKELYQLYLKHPVICIDSRKIEPGCIFFALKGENFNGNHFAREALAHGAALAVVDEPIGTDERFLVVEDVLKVLQDLASMHRREINAKVIGITGSNGKTTTKELIFKVLSSTYKTKATSGNLNNHIGLPLTLLSLDRSIEYAVVEMGANHIGEIARLCEIAGPDYGLITNIGKAHLEGFGSLEGIIKAKSELYEHLRRNKGFVFLNSDNPILVKQAAGITNYTYGTGAAATCKGKLLTQDPYLTLEWTGTGTPNILETKLYGAYNFENVMAAVAVGNYFEVPVKDIHHSISSYEPSNNRSQVFHSDRDNTLILDAYNANPTSMESAIRNFYTLPDEHKMVILGDMLELGSDSLKEHSKILELLKDLGFQKVFLAGEIFYSLPIPSHWSKFPDTDALKVRLKESNISAHTILIKGSRKIGLESLKQVL